MGIREAAFKCSIFAPRFKPPSGYYALPSNVDVTNYCTVIDTIIIGTAIPVNI